MFFTLLKGKWSRKHEYCRSCGGTDSPHKANGECLKCYKREYMLAWFKRREQEPSRVRSLWSTVHFFCPVCKESIDTGIDVANINRSLSVVHHMRESHLDGHQARIFQPLLDLYI